MIWVNNTKGFSASLFVEEKVKSLKRTSKSAKSNYIGSFLEIHSLNHPRKISVLLKFSQTIHSERDRSTPCKNYPYEKFESYSHCDEAFVYNKILKISGFIPFWTARSFDETTKQGLV